MSHETKYCRLCLNSQDLLKNLTDELRMKISFCLDIKLYPDENLTSCICLPCENNINNFFNFKKKCVDVNTQLSKNSGNVEWLEFKNDCIDNDEFHDTLESLLNIEVKRDKNSSCLDRDINNYHNILYEDIEDTDKRVNTDKFSIDSHSIAQKNIKNTKNQKVFQCEMCGRILKTKSVLDKHLLTHSGVKLFSCKICPKQFSRQAHKVIHMRTHMGIRPYTCEICGISTTKRQDLIRHLRIHSDEKNYACSSCGKRFKRSGDVISHMRTHTGARPYKCNQCEKSYTSHSGLHKHYKTHRKREHRGSNPITKEFGVHK